jgi:hypothetical protein
VHDLGHRVLANLDLLGLERLVDTRAAVAAFALFVGGADLCRERRAPLAPRAPRLPDERARNVCAGSNTSRANGCALALVVCGSGCLLIAGTDQGRAPAPVPVYHPRNPLPCIPL